MSLSNQRSQNLPEKDLIFQPDPSNPLHTNPDEQESDVHTCGDTTNTSPGPSVKSRTSTNSRSYPSSRYKHEKVDENNPLFYPSPPADTERDPSDHEDASPSKSDDKTSGFDSLIDTRRKKDVTSIQTLGLSPQGASQKEASPKVNPTKEQKLRSASTSRKPPKASGSQTRPVQSKRRGKGPGVQRGSHHRYHTETKASTSRCERDEGALQPSGKSLEVQGEGKKRKNTSDTARGMNKRTRNL